MTEEMVKYETELQVKDTPESGNHPGIQEKVMEKLTGMVICWSSHVTGQKAQGDAIQEIRKNTASILGWLDDLENEQSN
jgi:hypothetical protein